MPTATPILIPHVPAHDRAPSIDRHADLLAGSYDCVDRIVLAAYHSLCHSPGGFRSWWRQFGSEGSLDDVHLKRLAGRFAAGFERGRRRTASRSSTAPAACANTNSPRSTSRHMGRGPASSSSSSPAPATVYAVRRSAGGVIAVLQRIRV